MHLILNISIIKTVSLETYYVIFLLIKECFWKHLNKNNEIKYRGHLFFIYFATKINLNFTKKKICCIHFTETMHNDWPLLEQMSGERTTSHCAGLYFPLWFPPPLSSYTSAWSSCVLAKFLHHDTKTLLVRIILGWRKASTKPAGLRWNAHCMLSGHGVLRVPFMKD